jgi:hypothetical protein
MVTCLLGRADLSTGPYLSISGKDSLECDAINSASRRQQMAVYVALKKPAPTFVGFVNLIVV